jgi:alpha-galactosidase
MRNGKRAGGGMRYFLNFTNPEVRNYIHGIIDRVVSMGADYIKNDYNDCIGIGDDELGTTASDGLITHIKAFYSFIDEVRARHPRLIIENCGSGAMREDYGILSHFHLQSLTDQVVYKRCPSVIAGSLAAVLPEQLGIWTYPWPIAINDYDKIEKVQTEEYKKSMEDGEQTVFNLVNGLCGNMYLSGHIDCADDKNTALIKEGIELYKAERSFIHNAYPFWPLGFNKINDENTWAALGLASEDNKRVLLAVWRLKSSEDYMELPLYKWQGRKASVKQLYPQKDYHSEVYYNSQKGSLTVQLDMPFTARYFEIVEE